MITKMVDGVELHEAGTWDSRVDPMFVLVHGGSHGAWCWQEHIMPGLVAAGRAVAALDWYGHGGSRPARNPLGRTLADVADDEIATVLRYYAPRPVILVGHSMGGLAALVAASLPWPNVVGLGLLAPAVPENIAGDRPRFVPWREDRFYNPRRWPLPLTKALFFPDSSWSDARRYRRRLVPESGRIIRQTTMRELDVDLEPVRRLETTVVCGTRDRLVDFGQTFELAIETGATFRPLEGAGHGLWAGRWWPDVLDSLLRLAERVDA